MKTKLTPNMCYIAGLQSRSSEARSAVGVRTSIQEIEEKFAELCIKELAVPPNRLIIDDEGEERHIYFYHSRIYKRLHEVIDNQVRRFRWTNEFSGNYVAGMFDCAGYLHGNSLSIRGITSADAVMLEQLGIRTEGNRIKNITKFIALIKGYSIMLERMNPDRAAARRQTRKGE